MQLVTHFFFLNIKIELIIFVGFDYDGHTLGNGNAVTGKANAFCRVIGNEANAGQASTERWAARVLLRVSSASMAKARAPDGSAPAACEVLCICENALIAYWLRPTKISR